jgi:hypothetical protein
MCVVRMLMMIQRIQILASSKHIRVEIDGVEVANTTKAKLLYETGLPIRSYIPMTDVRLDLFTPSNLVTQCPYKVRFPFVSVAVLELLYNFAGISFLMFSLGRCKLLRCQSPLAFITLNDNKERRPRLVLQDADAGKRGDQGSCCIL